MATELYVGADRRTAAIAKIDSELDQCYVCVVPLEDPRQFHTALAPITIGGRRVAVSWGREFVATAHWGGMVSVYRLTDPAQPAFTAQIPQPQKLHFLADGRLSVSTEDDGVWMLSVHNGEETARFPAVEFLCTSLTGDTALGLHDRGSYGLIRGGEFVVSRLGALTDSVNDAAPSKTGTRFYIAEFGGPLRCLDLAENRVVWEVRQCDQFVYRLAESETLGCLLALRRYSAYKLDEIVGIDAETGEDLWSFAPPGSACGAIIGDPPLVITLRGEFLRTHPTGVRVAMQVRNEVQDHNGEEIPGKFEVVQHEPLL